MHTPTTSLFGGQLQVTTNEGERIWLDVAHPELVVRSGEGEALQRLPYPSAGYGGHELLLSPSETYLALWLYSGQSEVGYELFRFEPDLVSRNNDPPTPHGRSGRLEHLARLPYVYGSGRGPVFSESETKLALAWTVNGGLNAEELELDDEDRTLREGQLDWAVVHVRELPEGSCDEVRIRARIPAGFPYEGDDYHEPIGLFVSDREVRFETTWGTQVQIPLGGPRTVTIDGPGSRSESPA